MPSLFSRLKGRDGATKAKSKKQAQLDQLAALSQKPRWDDAWTRTTVEPYEIQELVRLCKEELKARALDHPFLLLPFRPTSDPSAVRTFVRHFFDGPQPMQGEHLAQELRMTEPMVISGVMKWCWSRLQGGVVGWDSYELFKVGEQDSNMASDSFKTFIPLSVDTEAKAAIIIDFFDLLSAVAAHGKVNGFGGRKLSRMAAWWAFEHKETGSGFEGGYKEWLRAADATSHLFFAYLRTLAPQPSRGGMSMLPMSLQKLLQETEYPPQRPSLMQSTTNKVVMIVDTVSPTPFALLRRANHFQYRDEDRALREWSEYEDPVQALTEECRRVLRSISAANQSQAVSSSKHSTGLRDASWSRFEDIGFSSTLEEEDDEEDGKLMPARTGLRTTASSGHNLGRPTTPSWADFLSSGFVDDSPNGASNMLLPPDKVLPPIETQIRQRSSQSHRPRLETENTLEPGELASITRFELDDAFWWVWMASLAPEETPERKSAFGRCAVIETIIRTGRWLVMEEMVKGAAPEPDSGAYIAEKKGFFSWTRRNKTVVSRRKSTGKHALDRGDGHLKPGNYLGLSKTSIGPDQTARIQAAAQQLQARQLQDVQSSQQQQYQTRRGRTDVDLIAEKTNSVFTLQPSILSEASPAVKWANKYDKEAIREAYLANSNAGRGIASATMQTNGHTTTAANGYDKPPAVPEKIASPTMDVPDDIDPVEEPETPRMTEKAIEAPQDLHPAQREADLGGRSTPLPPAKESLEVSREDMMSPEPEASPESKKQGRRLHKEKEKEKTGGFRKLFGRNKIRQSKLPENAATQLSAMGVNREPEVSVAPTPEPAEPEQLEQPQQPAPGRDEVPFTHPVQEEASRPAEPVESVPEPTYEESVDSRINTADALEAKDEFARFDQGPLVDQPAFVPDEDEDTEDDAVPPPIARHPSHSPLASPALEHTDGDVTPKAAPLDRWAQIRKNAADRAAARQGEETSRGGQSRTTDGEEDTSGEETIESRVARIKARVAELTNNMDTNANRPPPSRR